MKRFIHGCILSASLAVAGGAHAEVVLNGSGTPLNGNIEITSNLGVTRGGNLFHSFSVFNVLNGESVVFSAQGSIHNVISRVTGGTSAITHFKSSLIDGPVKVDIAGANFYFINPNGVIFGANGSINATGSVYVSTADVVRLSDGNSFYADPAENSVLTAADPVAFGFLSTNTNPATIELNGPYLGNPDLGALVPPGKTFALVGGNIDLQAGTLIVAPGATVSLASVASAGEAKLSAGAIDVSGFPALGQIRLSGTSYIDVSDWTSVNQGASGSIYIRGGQLTLSQASGLLALTFGDIPVGDVPVGAIDIAVRGDMVVENDDAHSQSATVILAGSGSYIYGVPGGLGVGPKINLDVGGNLVITNSSFVTSESYGPGPAGDIYIHAGGIEVRSLAGTGISAENHGDGAGPSLTIDVGSLQVLNGGFVGTTNDGQGTGGDLSIIADSVLATGTGAKTLSLSTETTGGQAGKLTLDTRTLELRDGARVSSSTAGFGAAGEVNIVAHERISVSGEFSGIFSQTNALNAGNAGALDITTPLLLMDGGVIDSITVGDGNAGPVSVHVGDLRLTGGGQIRSFSGGYDQNNNGALVVGNGAAGSVSVDATGSVTASGSGFGRPSGLLAETRGTGAGGDVNVSANSLTLSDGATISSSSLGSGLAGNISIALGDSLILSGASIATQAISSDGGNITITAPRLIQLADSRITTSVGSDAGRGGNIFIDPQFVVLQNSQIIANAFEGPGGNINIIAGQLIADPNTVISASSALGIDGSVNIDAPDSDVSAGLAVLSESLVDAAGLMRASCGAARAGLSSLVQVGRGGLPSDPDDYLPSLDLGTAVSRSGGTGVEKMGGAVPFPNGMLAFAPAAECWR
jgi:filamentous hemagglutinin family protein